MMTFPFKFLAIAAVTLTATTAQADTVTVYGTAVNKSTEVFSIVQSPERQCWTEDKPVYRNKQGGDDLGAFLGGAIIGGILGGAVDGGDGGKALGAILGGALANENQKNKNSTREYAGTRQEKVCRTVTNEYREHRGWRTRVKLGNKIVTVEGNKKYWKGNRVPVEVTIN